MQPSPSAPFRSRAPLPRAAPRPSGGRGCVLAAVTPLLPSANPQGPGSMETVRLIQNMCKMIFFFFFLQAKLKDTRLTWGPFGEGYRRKLRFSFMPGGEGRRLFSCSPSLILPLLLTTLPLWTQYKLGLLPSFPPENGLCTPPNSASCPNEMNEDAVPVNSRSREQ